MSSSALPLPLSSSTSSITHTTSNHTHHHGYSSSSSSNQTPHTKQLSSHLPYPSPSDPPTHQPKKTIRSRLSQLCHQGKPHLARQLFDAIPQPKTVLWNTIIIGFICNGMPDEALRFYSRMVSTPSDAYCDFYTYSAVLKACADARQPSICKAVHCHVLRSCLESRSRIVYNSLLNMYCTCLSSANVEKGYVDDLVCRVFGSMCRRDVIAWNTMISWMGSVRRANLLYGFLLKLGSKYANDQFALSSAIFMYAELGCLDLSRNVFYQSLERNTEVWNTMIGGYVQKNSPVEAINLFLKALASEQTILDEVTFLSALTAASQLQRLDFAQQLHAYLMKNSANGLDDEGLMLVHEMQQQGFTIDSVAATALLSAASNLRNLEIGKQTHAYILRHGIEFEGMESYLIDMYAKSGLIKSAQGLFEMCSSYGKDQATWNAMIAGNTQNGQIEQAFTTFRQMFEQNIVPNAVTIASILLACQSVGIVSLGSRQATPWLCHSQLFGP
ncbi:hypothetical protein RHGRI_005560 [Rhododendron griersonianum]|uniref:Pentatricopeptide repeat-containing protein n=1 Tax=Rhododendron griersonianum TaxID=479676 RepID=A0AAV6LCR6_9ERIC|nr:hypothetical protein RHGRI_005560 [Rhododendron griersonianum]